MSAERNGRLCYRFGAFTVHPDSLELRKNSTRLKLREQPFRILVMLLERPGDLVTREQLRGQLWPDRTFVEFDKSLNTAVNKLREVLCDSASDPRFVETVPRHGYRFVAPVEKVVTAERPSAERGVTDIRTEPEARPAGPRRRRALVAAIAICLLLGVVAAATRLRRQTSTVSSGAQWTQLTALDSAVQPSLSPDGRMLAFIRGQGMFYGRGEIYVKLLPGGEPVQITHDELPKMRPVFSPDGSRIAYTVVDKNFAWDTWIVPVLGGQPRLWLRNASGLEWTSKGRLLFSEIRGSSLHMGIVTAGESRADSRDVYFPVHERGMAHRSALSPDGRWVVLTEMDNSGFLPCRVVPMDGSSRGKQVGPANGACLDAAWSKDGRWLYLTSNAGGTSHIWRQRFPEGTAQQITSGPTDQSGIFVAPDGESLLTSVGFTTSKVWIHDKNGDREVTLEGSAYLPSGSHHSGRVFSPDGRKLYCLVNRPASGSPATELWEIDVQSGSGQRMFTGIAADGGYDISADGKQAAFVSTDSNGRSVIFIAPLDKSSPPQRIEASDADNPCFANDGTLFFRVAEGSNNYVFRLDGRLPRKIIKVPILVLKSCSPDGKWVAVAPSREYSKFNTMIYSTRSDAPPLGLCQSCTLVWSRDGRFLYLTLSALGGNAKARTHAIKLRPGSAFPAIPPGGITVDNVASLPVAKEYQQGHHFYPGADLSTYAGNRQTTQRNIYRIPLR